MNYNVKKIALMALAISQLYASGCTSNIEKIRNSQNLQDDKKVTGPIAAGQPEPVQQPRSSAKILNDIIKPDPAGEYFFPKDGVPVPFYKEVEKPFYTEKQVPNFR